MRPFVQQVRGQGGGVEMHRRHDHRAAERAAADLVAADDRIMEAGRVALAGGSRDLIDRINVRGATLDAMRRAASAGRAPPWRRSSSRRSAAPAGRRRRRPGTAGAAYGTAAHRAAMASLGVTRHHRLSFKSRAS
jgi:ribonuclease HII